MLINVFGIWIAAANILMLQPANTILGYNPNGKCCIEMGAFSSAWSDHTCDEVAAEINRQTAERRMK